MAQRAVGRLFRGQSSGSLRPSVGSFTQRRNYSRDAIPTFPPSSSPELDQALNRFREELFVPFGLNEQQRRLMFRHKYADILDEEPVTVNIGKDDEPFLLRPMDPMMRPANKEAIDTIALMKTPKDFQNLVPFLTGLRMSHRHIKYGRWEWVIRRANQADALGVILECAKQADKTGLYLKRNALVQRLFFELHRRAQREEFQDPALSKALRLATQAITLMESPEHTQMDPEEDPKRKPFMVGVLLELHAARALNLLEGKDEGNSVRSYALRLLGTWSNGNFKNPAKTWPEVDLRLQEIVPIYNGLKLALQVLETAGDKSLYNDLKGRMNELNMVIARSKQMAPENVKQRLEQQPTTGYEQAVLLHQD
ncbi:uncharacterized protein ASPGLDRAFT_173632 [Aspergillus glaucus CBS 516.65]|uniref:Uncharacterized protein n=1 Tax=Aspergillus glaucus CBS 516.65 TaxID=1160497 RepID=A0A1L9VGW4_ASPGL|nr:hypothetical protein ASPGLDRAFT_173632 [Aspergillus glaucus CBS 516.65]OJJ83125.1 hypothetical protein ASPGLDRAFT_173632 [Aspergillus glaucus CBS 516.65]